jgi:hypothetical protein
MRRRATEDRRTGEDRRRLDDREVVELLGRDRRAQPQDRRELLQEKRRGWVRVSQWSSVCVDPKALFY